MSGINYALGMQEGSVSSVSKTFHPLYGLNIFIPLQVNIQLVR